MTKRLLTVGMMVLMGKYSKTKNPAPKNRSGIEL